MVVDICGFWMFFCGFVISVCERYGFFKGLLVRWDCQAQQNRGLLAYYLRQGQISFYKFHFLVFFRLKVGNSVWLVGKSSLRLQDENFDFLWLVLFTPFGFFVYWKLNLCRCYQFYCMIKVLKVYLKCLKLQSLFLFEPSAISSLEGKVTEHTKAMLQCSLLT